MLTSLNQVVIMYIHVLWIMMLVNIMWIILFSLITKEIRVGVLTKGAVGKSMRMEHSSCLGFTLGMNKNEIELKSGHPPDVTYSESFSTLSWFFFFFTYFVPFDE
ncbi:hypothetical protein P3S67_002114 [Capsicum chacoense]